MKKIKVLLVAFIAFSQANFLLSQEESKLGIRPFGIGLHIEQFKISDISSNLAPVNKIIFSFSPSNALRFEPEFGLWFQKSKNSGLSDNYFSFGLGMLTMKQISKVNIYGGLRFEFGIFSTEDLDYMDNKYTSTINRLSIGPAIGCEYFFGTNFSFGGEFAIKYHALNSKSGQSSSTSEITTLNTETGLVARFYF